MSEPLTTTLTWRREPPDAEGKWAVYWAGRLFCINVWQNLDKSFGCHERGERVVFVPDFAASHHNALYARVALPEGMG